MIRTNSIRWRLLMWLAALLVAVLGGFATSVWFYTKFSLLNEIDQALELRVAALAYDVRRSNGPGGPGMPPNRPPSSPGFNRDAAASPQTPRPLSTPERAANEPAATDHRPAPPTQPPGLRNPGSGPFRPNENRIREITLSAETTALLSGAGETYYFAVWTSHGTLLKKSDHAPELGERFPVLPAQTVSQTRRGFRETTHVTERGDRVLVGISLDEYDHALWRLGVMLGIAGFTVLALAVGIAGWLVTQALRPIGEISRTAQRIAAGDLSERVRKTGDDELNDLAGVLNSTFARLETAFAEQRQFTADASHELRTPLTVIISEAQSALARPRSSDEYRETVENCLEAAQDMRRLAESLLLLARIDGVKDAAHTSPVDLAELARTSIELIRPLAAQREILVNENLVSAVVTGDPSRLRQVLLNLLDNAIYYNVDRGTIRVEVRPDQYGTVLVIADTGRGIAPEDLPHIFKRFYRADKARTHVQGRSGLGLAIVKGIVEAHRGTVQVVSTPDAGTTFTIHFPAA